MGSSPTPPAAPDPIATTAAQTGENVDTAIANAFLQNTDQTDSLGDTSTYNTRGTYSMTDPLTGQTYQIPEFTQQTTLAPGQQQIQNSTQLAEQELSGAAGGMAGNVLGAYSDPSQIPSGAQNGQLSYNTQAPGMTNVSQGVGNVANGVQQVPGGNLGQYNASTINNMLNTQWEQPFAYQETQNQNALNDKLANMGINVNDPGYNAAQNSFGQNEQMQQDTYDSSMYNTAAGAINSVQQLNQSAGADNAQNAITENQDNNQNALTANQDNNQNALSRYTDMGQVNSQNYANDLSGNAQNYNEAMSTYQEPMNLLNGLLGTTQLGSPTFQATPSQTIPTANYAQNAQNSFEDNQQNYQDQEAQQSSMMGGLFGLGGSVISGGLAL